jgi:hypothetical protein
MLTGSTIKLFVTGAVTLGAVCVAAGEVQARPYTASPVLTAEMQRRDWQPPLRCGFPIRGHIGRC